jgi:hypothetical protein
LSVRLNQEAFEIASKGVSSAGSGAGNVRLNQEVLEVAVKRVSASGTQGGNVRLNQLAFLFLTPTGIQGQRVQIIGGPFEDALGNVLSNGYLIFQLQHDAAAPNVAQIVGNMSVKVPLDINGFIRGTTVGAPVFIWPNDILSPAGGNYIIWAYDSVNRLAWNNPQIQRVLSVPSPFNVNAWIPGP